MKIEQEQIDSVEPFGVLDGKQVNLVKLKGGLNLASTTDRNGQDTVIGAASHQAILCYSIEQKFPNFQPRLMKSESLSFNADSHSHFLSDDLRKSGHDIYSVQTGDNVDFYVTKLNIKVACVNSSKKDSYLEIKAPNVPNVPNVPNEYVNAISSAVSEKALSSGLKGVRFK